MFSLNQLTTPRPAPGISLESYSVPVPDPPFGLHWVVNPDKTWNLIHDDSGSLDVDVKTLEASEGMRFAYHVITPDDTLEGVCLKYSCKPLDIRRLNGLSGNTIQTLRLLKIRETDQVKKEATTEEASPPHGLLVQEFMLETGEGREEAEFYLSGRDWRIELALADWKNDDEAADCPRLGISPSP